MIRQICRHQGFSVPELIVSIGIIALLAGVSLTSFSSVSKSQALDASTASIVFALRDARSRTIASVGGSQYGVAIEPSRYILFHGSSYSPSASSNVVTQLSSLVRASSTAAVFTFERVTGNSSASGTIDVYLSSDFDVKKTVRVQATGLVDIQQ